MGRQVFEIRYDRWNGRLMGFVGLGRRHARVVVDDHEVTVGMGWGFRARIARERIQGVSGADRPFIGWGVHGWRGRWLVNGSLEGLVVIEIDPPVRGWALGVPLRLRQVYVSLADPDAFQAALRPITPSKAG